MNVEIINIGTELLLGEITNTNAVKIQKMCSELGYNVFYQTTVGDNANRILNAFETAFNRGANCVITTGGLGPTTDDITKELSAKYLNLEMCLIKEEYKKVDNKCKYLNSKGFVSTNNYKQAFFPKQCYILENKVGTANGCIMYNKNKIIINLPGPPKELNWIIDNQLFPLLNKHSNQIIYTKNLIVLGIGESLLETKIIDLINNQNKVTIALYANEDSVRIRLANKNTKKENALILINEVESKLKTILKDYTIIDDDIFKYLIQILPSFKINYLSDYQLNKEFKLLNYQSNYVNNSELIINIDRFKNEFGDSIIIEFINDKHNKKVVINNLGSAELSSKKIETKLMYELYKFIKEKQG